MKLNNVLKGKNSYLFKAKNVITAEQLVKGILDAYLSSQEERVFGKSLEKLAVFVNQKVYNGQKSQTHIFAVNGCCYGKYGPYDRGNYIKICGQDFWYFISRDKDFYQDIIGPLGHKNKEKGNTQIIFG